MAIINQASVLSMACPKYLHVYASYTVLYTKKGQVDNFSASQEVI